jgi:GTP cyclohydrolase I
VRFPAPGPDELERTVLRMLDQLGEDPRREGLLDTPRRVAESMRFLTEGYAADPRQIVGDAIFEEEDSDDLVVVKDIPFFSLCEHHLLPFFGKANVAYCPNGRVVGLSKIPRIVDAFAHRLQIQERLTRQVAEALDEVLEPSGVGVVVTARHLCLEMRGVEKPDSTTVTSCMLGAFRSDARTRAEFMELIKRG